MGDQAAPLLALMPLDNIVVLCIISDNLGNRGFKQLMKLKLPKLKNLFMDNTSCTDDCVKMFKKRPNNYLQKINFSNCRSNANLLVKEIASMTDLRNIK